MLEDYSHILMTLPGVLGIDQGEYNGELRLMLFVAQKSSEYLAGSRDCRESLFPPVSWRVKS